MDSPEFLQYFWDLGSFEEKTSASSIEGIVRCLDNSVQNSINPKVKDVSTKSIIILSGINNGRADLEYTLSRLIKGLESQRECVRRGYSACLSIVLDRYKIPVSDVLEGLEKHYLEGMKKEVKGKATSGSVGDVRDRIIGLLLGYLAIIKTGFFKKNVSRPYIEQTIENLWMIYGIKMYLQDMICEIIYLILRDCCEYDPRLPIKYVSSKLGNVFDNRFLDKSEMNETKRNQLASQIPVLSLFLKLRLFLEGRDGVVINGVIGCSDISQAGNISARIGDKWEDWNKLFFNPGYTFYKNRWEIVLSNIQYLSLFSPRIPSFLFNLMTYILESPCLNEKISGKLISDLIHEIEEKYFSGAYSPQKHYFGARMILQIFTQLKLSAFSLKKYNFSEKSFIRALKNFISGHSKSLNWALKTSLNDKNPLSAFSTLFLQTLVDIITGRGIETHFAHGSQFNQIQDFSRFIFGTIDEFSTEANERSKPLYPNSSINLEANIRNLIPFVINDLVIALFWDETEDIQMSEFMALKESLVKPISISGKERVRLFWIILKSLMLKTGAKMKHLIKMFSDLLSQGEGESLDSIIISQGILLIDEISKEYSDEGKQSKLDKKDNNQDDVDMDDSNFDINNEEEDEKVNIYWRKIQWVHNIMLEFVQVSFSSSLNSGEEKNILPLVLKLSSQVYPLLDSIITFGASNEKWIENYRQIIFPRLEKIIGKCTNDLVLSLEDTRNNDVINEDSALIESVSSYRNNIAELFDKANQSTNFEDNKKLFNKNKKVYNAIINGKTPKTKFEISCILIESCLLIYYIMEDCNSSYILELISSLLKSGNNKGKRLEIIFNSMIKLDITNEGNQVQGKIDDLDTDEDNDYPSCLAGLSLLFQLNIRILDISKNLNTKLLVEFSRKIAQLPDLLNAHSSLMDGNDENYDDEDSEIEAEIDTDNENESIVGTGGKRGGSKHSSSLENDEVSQLLKPNIFSKECNLSNDGFKENEDDNTDDENSGEEGDSKDEIISCNDSNSMISHLLNDENTPLPPKYERQREQKEQEKLQIQRINNEMQNKLRMLETISLISEQYKPKNIQDREIYTGLVRTIILLLEGFRLGCKHALYYSIRSTLTIFSDYVNKLASTINKLMHLDVLKEKNNINLDELGDLFKLLVHIIGKPIVEPQTMSRWSKKNNGKQLRNKMENYSKHFETLSINLIALIVMIDRENVLIGQLIAQDLIKKWISQKRFGIVTSSFLTKLMHRIKNSNNNNSLRFLTQSFINNFEETVKYSKGSYQLREYTTLINHTLIACSTGSEGSSEDNDKYIQDMIQVVVKMIDNCISSNTIEEVSKVSSDSENIKFTTEMQRLELLKSLISLSKSIIIIENNSNTIGNNNSKDIGILERKISESNSYLNSFNQNCSSGKVKRQINKLKNIINSSNNNKGSKRIKVY
ncbi:unnamed protein product [Cryptosporidium hominis]|uniref:Uncharacterized protein n=1 Tax=Cryptosporidium hominis TaxID=237895 RepID=A0A0S4TFN7_CRYHO|nr:hypothetical protein ChTU502y2012_374g0280 [Cryptosporidium hominis]PPA64553.1 hypothetical protein ChUKH1_03285 [Cryptosporidium hominis]CUV06280.1 unnamed protein product [Cryptosporidium hominis]